MSTQINVCEICFGDADLLTILCTHIYCHTCIRSYITNTCQGNLNRCKCPNPSCEYMIQSTDLRNIDGLDAENLEFTQSIGFLLNIGDIIRCPMNNCENYAMRSISDTNPTGLCVNTLCRARVCMSCKVLWHNNMTCDQYGNSVAPDYAGEELLGLRRCPGCRVVIERTEGCAHMRCRCEVQFCYICGEEYQRDQFREYTDCTRHCRNLSTTQQNQILNERRDNTLQTNQTPPYNRTPLINTEIPPIYHMLPIINQPPQVAQPLQIPLVPLATPLTPEYHDVNNNMLPIIQPRDIQSPQYTNTPLQVTAEQYPQVNEVTALIPQVPPAKSCIVETNQVTYPFIEIKIHLGIQELIRALCYLSLLFTITLWAIMMLIT